MKNYFLILAFLLFVSGSALSTNPDSTAVLDRIVDVKPRETKDSIAVKIANLESANKSLSVTIENLRKESKTIRTNNSELTIENKKFDERNKVLQDEKIDLMNQNTNLKTLNDSLQRKLITLASNFIYIPYEEYSINEIAIPAFDVAKTDAAYKKYMIRLEMLQNYKADIERLIKFLEVNSSSMKQLESVRKENGQKLINNLKRELFYIRYNKYDDWQGTYLGKKIEQVKKILNSAPDNALEQLQTVQAELTKLLAL